MAYQAGEEELPRILDRYSCREVHFFQTLDDSCPDEAPY
jgi:hypothetical protein